MSRSDVVAIDEIEVYINHPYLDIWMPLRQWMGRGPLRSRAFIRPIAARSSLTQHAIPLTVVPLEYRNDAESISAILEGTIPDPWHRLRRAVAGMCLHWLTAAMQECHSDLEHAVKERDAGRVDQLLRTASATFVKAVIPLRELNLPLAVDMGKLTRQWQAFADESPDWEILGQVVSEQHALLHRRSATRRAVEYGLHSPQRAGESPIL